MTTGNFVSNVTNTLGQMGRKLLNEGARRLESLMPKTQNKTAMEAQPIPPVATAKSTKTHATSDSTAIRTQARTTDKRTPSKGRRTTTKSKGRGVKHRGGSKTASQTPAI